MFAIKMKTPQEQSSKSISEQVSDMTQSLQEEWADDMQRKIEQSLSNSQK